MKVLCVLLLAVLVVVCSGVKQQATLQQVNNDVSTLNYALTLEHLEATYYTQGLAKFSNADFDAAGFPPGSRDYINLIRSHEVTHVNTLTSVINSLGGLAVRACQYNFNMSMSSVKNFIATAAVLENTGTMAYDGAANTINDGTILQVAATIATIEGKHTAYLNELNKMTPFPRAFDNAMSPEQIIQVAKGFLVSCPDNTELPVLAFKLVPLSYNRSYIIEGSESQPETSEQVQNDNDVLNYALTLELLGHGFYSEAANFTQEDFNDAGYGEVYQYFQMIIQQENAHVAFLTQTLQARGAQVAQSCSYNLGDALDSVENALLFARMLENLEVTAYDGAINSLTQYNMIQGAATIATVEARHAQFLNALLLNDSLQESAFDLARAPELILNITAPYFGADCVNPIAPVEAFTLQEYGTTAYVQPPPQPTPSPQPTPTPTMCPPQPTPTPTPNNNNNNNNDGGVTINFYFADILRGIQ